MLKHYKIGFLIFFVFLLLKEKKKKNDNWNFRFGFLVQKWPFCDAHLFFKKYFAETSVFIMFWGSQVLAKWSKKGSLDPHQKVADN